MDEDVLRRDRADHLAVVDRAVLEPVVGCFDEDLGFVSGASQHSLHAEDLVADRVAVAQRGEHLMDARAAAHAVLSCRASDSGITAPDGRRADDVGRRPEYRRRRRANHPGNGSSAGRGGPAIELPEHVQVLLLDHRPAVVARKVLAAIPSEAGVQRTVRFERVQRFGELFVALVVQPGIAADALSLEHVALAVGKDRIEVVAEPRHLVDKRDIDVAVGVLQQLGHLGLAGPLGGHHL